MITTRSLENRTEWEKIVTSFKQHDIYYSSHYVKAFQLHGDGEPLLILYEDHHIRALNVVMKRDIAEDPMFKGKLPAKTYYDIATPYGYGGFIIEGNCTEEAIKKLNDAYSHFCAANGIVSEIVRFHPVLNNREQLESMYDITPLGKTVSVQVEDKSNIWRNLNSNKRRWIKKAQQAGVTVSMGRSPQLFEQFQSMYKSTMQGNEAKDYYYFSQPFYDSILEDLAEHAQFFYATYNDEMIAMVLVLYCNGQVHHHLSASLAQYHDLAATNLIMYEIACWANEQQYETFHMGGGVGSKEDSLYHFKQGFNKQSNTTFAIGKKIFNEQKYYELLHLRQQESSPKESHIFFPLYRAQ